jgi:hypothetical protein
VERRNALLLLKCFGTPIVCCDEISTGLDGMFISVFTSYGVFATWLR